MKKDISICVIIFIIAAFVLRVGGAQKKHMFTYDEIVYSTLAAQISDNPANYNTIRIYKDALSKGRKLPEYFKNPLFKHPPVFTKIISFSYSIFGKKYLSAYIVPLFFGVMLIFLAYILGRLLFDARTGVLAAFLMLIEPIGWICSQKIWMETTLSFFTVLSIYFFALALKRKKDYFFLISGLFSGVAVLTKYPGILATGTMILYALLIKRELFKNKWFVLSLFIPALMLIPWIEWNLRVLGPEAFSTAKEVNYLISRISSIIPILAAALVALLLIGVTPVFLRKKTQNIYDDKIIPFAKSLGRIIIGAFLIAIVFMLRENIINALTLSFVPLNGWQMGLFSGAPGYFYLGRIIELSPFYIFSFIAVLLLILDKNHAKNYMLLLICAGLILTFYSFWGNFQSRYILASVVPLIVLSARAQTYLLEKINLIEKKDMKNTVLILFGLLFVYFMARTIIIDYVLAIPNNTCYF